MPMHAYKRLCMTLSVTETSKRCMTTMGDFVPDTDLMHNLRTVLFAAAFVGVWQVLTSNC
jgi:hypothetical protein